MEQKEPQQVIGVGTLKVQPDMSAVHKELDDIERRFEALGDIAKKITAGGDGQPGQIPQPNSDQAAFELDRADESRWREDVLDILRDMRDTLKEMQNSGDV
jgi:hypothetical protein